MKVGANPLLKRTRAVSSRSDVGSDAQQLRRRESWLLKAAARAHQLVPRPALRAQAAATDAEVPARSRLEETLPLRLHGVALSFSIAAHRSNLTCA